MVNKGFLTFLDLLYCFHSFSFVSLKMPLRGKKRKTTSKPEAELEAFSRSPIKAVCDRLDLEKFDREDFDCLKIEAVPLRADELTNLYNEIHRAWATRRTKHWNEAKARVFVNCVLQSVVFELLPRFKIALDDEANVDGEENHGKADVAIKFDNAILLAVEIKASCIDTAIAQCLLEMEAAREQNMTNRTDLGDTMFGIATTGHQWVLVKAVFGADKPAVSMTEVMYLAVKRETLVENTITEQLAHLHEQITSLVI
jgi:hypothetical protein